MMMMMKSLPVVGLSLALALQSMLPTVSAEGYDIGCIYPPKMPDPIEAQDTMIKFSFLVQPVFETPMVVHAGVISAFCSVGCLAAHDPMVKNPVTMARPLLSAPEHGHNAYSVAMCNLQCHTMMIGYHNMKPLIDRWDAGITEGVHPGFAFLEKLQEEPTETDLFNALNIIAENDYHPYLMGQMVIAEIFLRYSRNDGWNAFGDWSYDYETQQMVKCTGYCQNFTDTTGYQPRNTPGRPIDPATKYNVTGIDMYWQPLLESNGLGYFSRQEHVTPHLAVHAKLALDPDLREKRSTPPPEYDYYPEALKVIEELRQTAEDNNRKERIRVYDDKLNVRGIFQKRTLTQFPEKHSYQMHLLYTLGISLAEDDGTIMAWTEKIRHDLVRPTTVIQRWGNDEIRTYEPKFQDRAWPIAARNFEAFIRVMPHSEYPSGSACLCTTYRDIADSFTQHFYGEKLNNLRWGAEGDGFTMNCDGEIGEGLRAPVCNYSFVVADMTKLEQECGQSRLWGGMHFTKSVPAGHELCEGLGAMAVERVIEVMNNSTFGGNEYFLGDDRPLCSDPTLVAAAAEETNGDHSEEGDASGGSMLGLTVGMVSSALAVGVLAA